MPGGTSIRSNALWKRNRAPARPRMSHSDRLATAIGSEALVLPADGPVVLLRSVPGPALDLIGRDRLICEQSFRPTHDALADAGFRTEVRASGPASAVIVLLTRARAENLGNIARGFDMLAPGGLLAVAGAKTEGVDSLVTQVGRALPLDGQISKAHGRVFWLRRPAALPEVAAAWAEGNRPRPNPAGFVTAPGMFAPDAVDPGSRRLAEALPAKLRGRVADFGAGWGWLAIEALARAPEIARIDLFEAESRALDAARLNLADPRAGFHWADVTRLARGTPPYDAILANPPFHHGRVADPTLGTDFIAAAGRVLKPSGTFLMVANRQLPYEAALDAHFRHWERLSEDRSYKVIAASRPRRDT